MRTNIRLEDKVWSQYDRISGSGLPPTDQSAVTEPRESQDHASQGYKLSQGLAQPSQTQDSSTGLCVNGSQELNQPPSGLSHGSTQPSLSMNSHPELSQASQPPTNSGSIVKLDYEFGQSAGSTSADNPGQDVGTSATTDHSAVSNLTSTVSLQDPVDTVAKQNPAMTSGDLFTVSNVHDNTSSLADTGSNIPYTGSYLHDNTSNPTDAGSTLLDNRSNLHDAGSSHPQNDVSAKGSLDSPPMFDINLPITNTFGILSSTPATNNENPPNLVDISIHAPDFSSESEINKSSIQNSTNDVSSSQYDVSCIPDVSEEPSNQTDCSIEKDMDVAAIKDIKSNSSSNVMKNISLEPKLLVANDSKDEPSANLYKKPESTYVQIIAEAILASKNLCLVLEDIYEYFCKTYPYYRAVRGVDNNPPTWKNTVRHDLSDKKVFIKTRRTAKGHYWMIHPACIEDFKLGNFNVSAAKRKIAQYRQSQEQARIARYHQTTMGPGRKVPNVEASPIPYVPSGATYMSGDQASMYHGQQNYSPSIADQRYVRAPSNVENALNTEKDKQFQMHFQNPLKYQKMYQEVQNAYRHNYSEKSLPVNDFSSKQYLDPTSPLYLSKDPSYTATNSYSDYDSGYSLNFNNSARSCLYPPENKYVDYKGNVSFPFDGNFPMASDGYNNANNITNDSGFQSAVQSPYPPNSSLGDRSISAPLLSNQRSSGNFVSTPQLYNKSFLNTANETAGLQIKNTSNLDASSVNPVQSSYLKWPPTNLASGEMSNKKLAFHFSEYVQYPQPVSQQSFDTKGRQQNPASVNTQQFATSQNQQLYNQMNSSQMIQQSSFQSTASPVPPPGMQDYGQNPNQYTMQQNVNMLGVVQTPAQSSGQFSAQQIPQYEGYQGNYSQPGRTQQQMPSSSQNTTYFSPQNF